MWAHSLDKNERGQDRLFASSLFNLILEYTLEVKDQSITFALIYS